MVPELWGDTGVLAHWAPRSGLDGPGVGGCCCSSIMGTEEVLGPRSPTWMERLPSHVGWWPETPGGASAWGQALVPSGGWCPERTGGFVSTALAYHSGWDPSLDGNRVLFSSRSSGTNPVT